MRYMIRRLVGAAVVSAAKKDISVHVVRDLLAACNPRHTLLTAPSQGLVLYKISYKNPEQKRKSCSLEGELQEEDE